MPISQAGVIPNISAYLGFLDLCSLDAASKEILASMANFEGKPHPWLSAAMHGGLSFDDADKTSIKAVFGVFQNRHLQLRPRTVFVHGSKGAKQLTQAAQQMKNLRAQHLQSGGAIADPFIARFCFTPEDVKSYLAQPTVPLYSNPISLNIGKTCLQVALGWNKGKTWLYTEVTHEESLKPFSIQLRSASSLLAIRTHLRIWRLRQEAEVDALFCMPPTSTAFADILCTDGILCAGLVCDHNELDSMETPIVPHLLSMAPSCEVSFDTVGTPVQSLNALHLDMPRLSKGSVHSMMKLLRS